VKPEEIIQVTGATITSQAVVNGVNAAIGVMQYLDNGVKMGKVGQTVPKELWNMDDNSFAINWEGGSVRLTMEDMKKYPQVTVDAVLKKTTGTKSKIKIQGPELSQVLKEEGVDLKDYAGIGITGRDGYYTMVDEDKLSGSILLGWKFNDEEIRKDEKPIRVCLPDEMGPYWVKLVTTIDLYKEISPKNITKVHMFDALTRDIEPYEYEYYGSKDKSIEVGKILAKFESVDLKGFFSMYAVDGLEKNETISLVRDRYFIKVEGENAPMNIAPNFKLGMNVKNMSHFSTTKDSVIFPWKMEAISRTKKIEGKTYLYLEDVLVNAGLLWKGEDLFTGLDTEGHQFQFQGSDLDTCYISQQGKKVTFLKDGQEMTTDLLTIEKMQ
ncbi:MAG: molybdopterin-dependent oxidoreductase, partial [Anaerovorax sp.]